MTVDTVTTYFRSAQPQPDPALATTPSQISRDRLLKVADSLPGAPKVLTELENLLRDPNSELAMITALLRRDVSLTARVIRIANGVVYNRGEPVGVLEDALAKVGFSEVFRLISIASMLQLLDLPLRYYPSTPKQMRENSLFSALLMETMAPDVGIDSRTAYTTGLLRGVGRTVLDLTAQRDLRYVPVPPWSADEMVGWEMKFFGMSSSDAGGHVLKAWRFPADVFVAVRDQFLHDLKVDPLPSAKLLHVTLAAVNAVGYGLSGDEYYFDRYAWQACADLHLTEERVNAATEQAGRRFERMRAMLG